MFKTLEELVEIIRSRKNSTQEQSYTSQLLSNKNLSKEKVEEEVQELIEAIQKNKNQTHEAADLLYHLLVLLEANNIKIEDVMIELKKRQQKSGLEEKSSNK
jgi:phosphoribosyl-ATP pyrophosphohydrolase